MGLFGSDIAINIIYIFETNKFNPQLGGVYFCKMTFNRK